MVLLFLAPGVYAQFITGDTIYVNTKMEVSVSFPSRVSDFYTNPVDAPYNIKTVNDRSAITINAKNKNTLPASLTVVEGKRTHLFFIYFKKNISFSNTKETHLDYSTMQKLEDHLKQVAAIRALDKKYTVLKTSAENNIGQKKYKEAQEDCLQMLILKPDDVYAKSQLKKVTKWLDAETAKSKTTPISKEPTNKSNSIPQSSGYAELNAKYPQIDFTAYPAEQQFSRAAFDIKKNMPAITEMLAESARLDINGKSQKVKLTCQAIDFKNNNAFMKLLVQNNSKDYFLTGAMLLTWGKKTGNPVNLLPYLIYPQQFPVLKPGEASTIIYTFKPENIANEDHLSFTLNDRLNKIKLELKIKGYVFTEEMIRR